MTTYQDKKREIKEYCIERLKEIAEHMDTQDFRDAYVSDLHHEIFNTDYYIVGRYQAKEWMGADAFDMIGDVQEYEKAKIFIYNVYNWIFDDYLGRQISIRPSKLYSFHRES